MLYHASSERIKLYGLTDAHLAQDERFIKHRNALLEK